MKMKEILQPIQKPSYLDLAQGFVQELGAALVYHQGRWLRYRGDHYREISPVDLEDMVRAWMRANGVAESIAKVANTIPIVRGLIRETLPQDASLPLWRRGEGPEPQDVIALGN